MTSQQLAVDKAAKEEEENQFFIVPVKFGETIDPFNIFSM